MLLQILEEGRLTDSLGRQVDFRNTVVILTSNLGFDTEKQGQGLGFVRETSAEDYGRLRDRMINAAKLVFKPELLNRFDDIIVFRKLDKADVVKILDIELSKVRERLAAKSIQLALSPEATRFPGVERLRPFAGCAAAAAHGGAVPRGSAGRGAAARDAGLGCHRGPV